MTPTNVTEILDVPGHLRSQIAVSLYEQSDSKVELTWGHLRHGARREAARLSSLGIVAGNPVVLVLPTGRQFLDTFFGALYLGAIPVPTANPLARRGRAFAVHAERIERIVDDCGAAMVVTTQDLVPLLAEPLATKGRVLLAGPREELENQEVPPRWTPTPSETAMIQYTSGSTDTPKGVELSHRNIVANADGIAEVLRQPNSVCVSWLPLHHDMGLIGAALTSLYARVGLVLIPPIHFMKRPAIWFETISRHRGTITVAPNFAFDFCTDKVDPSQLDDVHLESLATVLNGSEPVDPAAVHRFETTFAPLGLKAGIVCPGYGLAESSLAVTFSPPGRLIVDEVDAERLETEATAVPATAGVRSLTYPSVGKPIPGQEIRIVDAHGNTASDRTVGEVLVRGDSVMKGYHGRPAETSTTLRDGWLHTGDLGYIANDLLYLVGRSKDIIIRHGKNYYPADMERRLVEGAELPVTGAAVFLEESSDSTVIAVVESRRRDEESLNTLFRDVRRCLNDAFLFGPDQVLAVRPGGIPRTTSGKIRRSECRRALRAGELRIVGQSVL